MTAPRDADDIMLVVDFILGWWPGLEGGLRWPADADEPDSNPIFAAATRLANYKVSDVTAASEAYALLDFCEHGGRWCESAVVHGSTWHLTVEEANDFERLRDNLRAALVGASRPGPSDHDVTLAAVLHELQYGEASEGDPRDLEWCCRELRGLLFEASPSSPPPPEGDQP